MKKLLISCTIFSAILLGGCKNDALELTDATEGAFVATIEKFENDAETKTSLSNQNTVVWTAGDQITIFQGAPLVSRFEVDEACEGTANGVFNPVQDNSSQTGGFTSVMEVAANVAVYPYADGLTLQEAINEEQEQTYTIANVTVPAQQEYVENSFPNGAFTMVAVTESAADKVLKFKNVLGSIKLQLLGDSKVKSIEVKGNKGEVLSGRANVTAYKGTYAPAITMLEEAATTVTLSCGEGIQLNPDNAINFIIALPPTNFEEGFTVTITDAEGNEKEIKTTASNTVQRSYILKMPKLNINHLNAGEELDYILFEDEIVEELCVNVFDTNNDGKLQFSEAAAVTDLRPMNLKNWQIKSFNELGYFTSLESIPDEHFKGQSQMTSVKLPSKIKIIGIRAFEDCSSLKNLSIPEGVEIVAEYTFSGCTSIKDVKLPSSLSVIETYAFANCSALNNVELPEGMKGIGSYAFLNCSSITAMTIPEKLKENEYNTPFLSTGIFKGCNSLVSVTLPSDMQSIYDEAFSGCKSLVNCEIPESVNYFGAYAFYGCESLEKINLTSSYIYRFEEYVFSKCNSLKTVTLAEPFLYEGAPLRKFDIGEGAFADCISLESVDFNINHIKSFGKEVFKNCESLQTVTIPATISNIPENAFEGCKRLKKVYGGAAVEAIEKSAFSGCAWLEEVEFLPKVKTIGEFAFENCALLNNITLNSEITTVLQGTFSGCSSLSLNLPETIVKLEDYAFSGCKSITLTNNNITIYGEAFMDCMDVNVVYDAAYFPKASYTIWADRCMSLNITIPEGVTAISDKAFQNREKLKNIYIPLSVKSIGVYAFNNCSSLASIEIPSSVESIGENAFNNCISLESIEIPSSVESISEGTFLNCSSLASIEIPSSVESIGKNAFSSCISLESIEIPSSVKSISERAFYYCSSLASIEIPSSVKSIENWAFGACSSLQSCTIKSSSLTTYGSNAFYGCSALTGIYVPSNSVDTYKAGWPDYADKIQAIQ